MIFLVFFRPHADVDRLKLFAEFEKRPRDLQEAVAVQRTFKVPGRNEMYLVVRATNLVFLDRAVEPFQDKAEITITPLVEQE